MTLIPQPSLAVLAVNHEISLNDLLDQLAKKAQEDGAASPQQGNPKEPTAKIAVSDVQRSLLRRLANVIADVELPSTRRQLTEEEKAQFIPLFEQVKDAKTALANAEAALHETFSNHLDAEARLLDGDFETDVKGHVLAEGEIVSTGYPKKVTRELRGGKAAPLQLADLQKLEADGTIDHKTFLALTEAVPATRRVASDEAIMDQIAKNPKLIEVLAGVVSLTPKTSAIYVRKNG